jgi:hypothetical protein
MNRMMRGLMLGVFATWLFFLTPARAQTVVWSENFDDGNGNSRWAPDNGVWQIGAPVIGPGAAHSPPYCAATGLTANYPAGANSRLIRFQSFTVPAASQSPRLRFWQWYSFASCNYSDYGVVEVKGTNGIWQAVSPNYTGNGGGWTYASVNLSAYAGQSVQVAFHIVYQNDCGDTAQGWYVDDVSLVTGTPVFNNPEGFEGGIGDWYAETGSWQVGQPTKTGGPATNSAGSQAHTGTNCAATVLTGNYPAGANSRFVSPAFTVPAASSSPYFRFWHWFNFASCNYNDYGVVEIRVGTNAWQILSSPYTGNSSVWSEPALSLSAYAGQTVQVAFHIVYQNDCGDTAPGWYVDDVSLQSFGQPVILGLPASQTLSVGSSTTLNVSAAGDSPLGCQWRVNSNSIAGATNTSLTLTNLQLANTGHYDVVVTNDAGSITSAPPALLQVVIAFTNTDIGDPGASGSFNNSNGVYTVSGSGEGTDGSADVFNLTSQPLTGDAQIIARFLRLQGGDPQLAEAGIMIRQSLDPSSEQSSLTFNASTNLIFRRRIAMSGDSIENVFRGTNYLPRTNYLQGTNYVWLRLMRLGSTFVAHYSTNGLNWQYLWFTTVNMTNPVQVGLAVTAHHYGELASAQFDNVSIGSPTPLSGTWPLPGPELLVGGQNWSSAELQRVGGFEFLLGGVTGDYFSIKSSTNLAKPFTSWTPILVATNTYGVLPVFDTQALTNKLQYYRAQQTEP